MDTHTPPAVSRLHGLDALRLFLMLLGIPYHAALIYSTKTDWLIKSAHSSTILTAVSTLLHSFRMGGFFLLSGFFAALVIDRRGNRRWLRARVTQLAVPLLVCMAVLTPPQIYLASLSKFMDPVNHLQDALNTSIVVLSHPNKLWVLHLWFLLDLLLISIAFGFAWNAILPRQVGIALDRAEHLAARHPLVAQAAMMVFFLLATLLPQLMHKMMHVQEVSLLDGLIQVESTLYFGAFFAFGAVLQSRAGLLAWFQQFSIANLLMSCVALILCVTMARSDAHVIKTVLPFVQATSPICTTRLLFWVVMTLLHKPFRSVRRAADAAFTVYLFHHPVIALLGFLCIRNDVGPLFAWSAIVITTTMLTVSFHRYVVARSRVLTFLLNGRLPAVVAVQPTLSTAIS